MSKNTGMPRRNPLPRKATGALSSPSARRAARTIRSVSPLSSRHLPMIAAIAIKITF